MCVLINNQFTVELSILNSNSYVSNYAKIIVINYGYLLYINITVNVKFLTLKQINIRIIFLKYE